MQNHTRFVTGTASLLQQYGDYAPDAARRRAQEYADRRDHETDPVWEVIPENARGLLTTKCRTARIEPTLADVLGGSVTRQVMAADDVERNDVERLMTDASRRRDGLERTSRAGHSGMADGVVPDLTGVSETMLLALHNRAAEAKRADGVLTDPDGLRIYESIVYDFGRHFGNSEGSLAVRAAEIDRVLRQWLENHPDGFVISLGEGLETQARRVDNGRMRWLSVDLPDAIRLREYFIPPTDRFRHLAVNALDRAWMDAVEPSSGLFIVAQGLFMYLDPEAVRRLFVDIAERFPDANMVFDVVPRWFSRLTRWGLRRTPHYRFPPMPWGINRDE